MISGRWCLYERKANRWLFHRRRQVLGTPALGLLTVMVLGTGAWMGWL